MATVSGKTATASGKSTTPFDQITALETREKERIKQEVEGMEREKREVADAVAKKEEQAEHELKEQARKELKEYGETELGKILKAKEGERAAECDALETRYQEYEANVVQNLVETMTDTNSPLFLKT